MAKYFKIKNYKFKLQSIILAIIIAVVFSISLGFSIFNENLNIAAEAVVRAQKDVRLTGVSVSSVENGASSNYSEYNTNYFTAGFDLPNQNSTITYGVDVTNFGNIEAAIKNISGLPSNLEIKSIGNYTLEDSICDSHNECTLGVTKNVLVTIGYKENAFDASNTFFNVRTNFDFRSVYSITYHYVTDNGYPSRILEGDSLEITFVDDVPNDISATGLTSYNYVSPTLTISNPTSDVVISSFIVRRHYERLIFDGTDYEDTGVYLFSAENINKNFEISFELSNVSSDQISQATILNSMYEVSPYPGFVFRVQSNISQIEFNSPKIKNKTGISVSSLRKVLIKRYNDVYYLQINDGEMEKLGTYTGGTFDVPVVLGASPDTEPVRYFKGTLTNVNIELTDQEFYNVKFDSNGGTGTMPDQSIRRDDSVNLNENVFEKEGVMFDSWNTEPDGSGTTYSDKQSVMNLAEANKSITLYAIWASPFQYYVKFNPNGGAGTIPNQLFDYGIFQNLSSNTFTKADRSFVKWNTKADGSGTDYSDGQSVRNLTTTENDVVNLYAIWAKEYYNHSDQMQFTGSNCEDTGVKLYSTQNVNNDYEISFDVVSTGSNANQATLMNSMYEVQPWPGILTRTTGSNFEVDMNGGSGSFNKKYLIADTNRFVIRRKSGTIYVSVNDGPFITTKNHSSITNFDTPVTFGCSYTSSNEPQRYFKGTLKNMKAILFE